MGKSFNLSQNVFSRYVSNQSIPNFKSLMCTEKNFVVHFSFGYFNFFPMRCDITEKEGKTAIEVAHMRSLM